MDRVIDNQFVAQQGTVNLVLHTWIMAFIDNDPS